MVPRIKTLGLFLTRPIFKVIPRNYNAHILHNCLHPLHNMIATSPSAFFLSIPFFTKIEYDKKIICRMYRHLYQIFHSANKDNLLFGSLCRTLRLASQDNANLTERLKTDLTGLLSFFVFLKSFKDTTNVRTKIKFLALYLVNTRQLSIKEIANIPVYIH